MSTIYYTKHFTAGLLKGVDYITSMTFDASLVDEYVKFMQTHKEKPVKAFGERFIITDFSFQNYQR